MTEHILIERRQAPGQRDGEGRLVQIIRLNRPDKKNAITRAMYAAMAEAVTQGDADAAIGAHVFLGHPGAFTSGNDLQDFLAIAMGGDVGLGTEVLAFLHALAATQKPVLAGVDGLAVGVGVTMHFHCDLTFATPQSRFVTPFVDLALVPEAASSLLAPMAMGHQKAFALLAAGIPFSGEEAEAAGLIYKLADADALEETVLAAAHALAAKPPEALALARRLIKPDPQAIRGRMNEESALFGQQLRSAEALAAFQAFMTRKK